MNTSNITATATVTASSPTLADCAAALRLAQSNYNGCQRRFDDKLSEVRNANIEALAQKTAMYDFFSDMVKAQHLYLGFKASVDAYDLAHERALAERNAAGDDLDRIAALMVSERYGADIIEAAAVRFDAAQSVLDYLQKGEAKAKRRADALEWRRYETQEAELRVKYHDQKVVWEDQQKKAKDTDWAWNDLRSELMSLHEVIDQCKANLRAAARDFASNNKG